MFPGELLSAMDMDLDNPGQVINRTEVKRREIYMKKLEVQFSESHPVLVQLVSQCLHNNPQARPSSEELLGKLHAVKTEVEKVYVGRQLNISNVLLVKEMKMKDKRIEELQVKFDIYSMCSEMCISEFPLEFVLWFFLKELWFCCGVHFFWKLGPQASSM